MENLVLARQIFELIRGSATLKVAKDFLKEKNLPHTAGTWDELFDKRVLPPLGVGTLTTGHLQDLLREVEEHGRQHVFLFKCKPERALLMLDAARVQRVTNEQQLSDIMRVPLALELPDCPQLVDLRWVNCAYAGKVNRTFVLKQVETRTSFEFSGQIKDPKTGVLMKSYIPVRSRAVNLARLHPDGTLEIRLASHKNSTQYIETLLSFRAAIEPWFMASEFEELSLKKAKQEVWEQRAILTNKIRHGGHTMKNDTGTTLSARKSSPNDDVLQDEAAEASLESFLAEDGYCESSYIYFKVGSGEEKREILVLLSGTSNEFGVPLTCNRDDYEYVFEQIRTLNS